MEDVKERARAFLKHLADGCFNPCFNGRCKRTFCLDCPVWIAFMFQSLF